jgi:hypothetical protein
MCDRVTPPSHVFWVERGANGNAIPVFVVEEHREAYFVISYAIKTGLLPPHGNALVHIDEHHDLACPVLLGPADVRSQPLSDIFVCTFDYLRICDFLIPLVQQRVFEELYWVRRDGLCHRSIPLDIRVEQVGNAYFFRVHTLKSRAEAGARRLPMLHTLTPSHPFATTRPVVLDIDFDYFSCSDSNGETVRIEITGDAYAAFIRDKRHPWKLAFGSRVTCMEEGGSTISSIETMTVLLASERKTKNKSTIQCFNSWSSCASIRLSQSWFSCLGLSTAALYLQNMVS